MISDLADLIACAPFLSFRFNDGSGMDHMLSEDQRDEVIAALRLKTKFDCMIQRMKIANAEFTRMETEFSEFMLAALKDAQ